MSEVSHFKHPSPAAPSCINLHNLMQPSLTYQSYHIIQRSQPSLNAMVMGGSCRIEVSRVARLGVGVGVLVCLIACRKESKRGVGVGVDGLHSVQDDG